MVDNNDLPGALWLSSSFVGHHPLLPKNSLLLCRHSAFQVFWKDLLSSSSKRLKKRTAFDYTGGYKKFSCSIELQVSMITQVQRKMSCLLWTYFTWGTVLVKAKVRNALAGSKSRMEMTEERLTMDVRTAHTCSGNTIWSLSPSPLSHIKVGSSCSPALLLALENINYRRATKNINIRMGMAEEGNVSKISHSLLRDSWGKEGGKVAISHRPESMQLRSSLSLYMCVWSIKSALSIHVRGERKGTWSERKEKNGGGERKSRSRSPLRRDSQQW